MVRRIISVQARKQERIQKALVKMIIIEELSFSVVEQEGFKQLILEATFPGFRIPTCERISRDCAQLFMDKKLKLKRFIKRTNQRVCLTLDTKWTSNQMAKYLSITAHFIDNNWRLHKKMIGFTPVFSNEGDEIGKAVEKCLDDWEINDVMTISIAGDTSVNEAAISYLRKRLVSTLLDGKFLHLRCIVSFFNTMVKDILNMNDHNESIARMRGAVRYVLQSPARIETLKECAREYLIKHECCLSLDDPNRWTSTYEMLNVCKEFEEAFDLFFYKDPTYTQDLEGICGAPRYDDWENVRKVVDFLEGFYRSTEDISGLYVSSNEFLAELAAIDFHLCNCGKRVDSDTMMMALNMKCEFDEYWGYVEKSNMLLYVANVLDPRLKTEYIEYYFMNIDKHIYDDDGEPWWKKKAKLVIAATYELFNEYIDNTGDAQQKANFQNSGYMYYLYEDKSEVGFFKIPEVGFGRNVDCKTEIDIYLHEERFENFDGFEILLWWKYNSARFPILSKMAKDVLAIPIAAVALESAFSTDRSLLDDFQSSLSPSIVEALICTQDWIRKSKKCKSKWKKILTDLDNFTKGIDDPVNETTNVCGQSSC